MLQSAEVRKPGRYWIRSGPEGCEDGDNYARLCTNTLKHNGSFAGKTRDAADWRYDLRPEIATTIVNAFYYGLFNQFFIFDGFISEDTYRLDMKEEEKLARLGEIIGHELTHGYDPEGIKYDKDGNMVQTEDNHKEKKGLSQ